MVALGVVAGLLGWRNTVTGSRRREKEGNTLDLGATGPV